MEENERLQREEKQKELEMLAIRKEADKQFALNEEEKKVRRLEDLKTLQSYHVKQIVCASQWFLK